jgi:hypothetical protein
MKIFAFRRSWLVLSLLFLTISSYAQKGDPNLLFKDSHFFTISLSGGATGYTMSPSYGSILSDNANFTDDSQPTVLDPTELKISPLVGGTFGFGYEYQHPYGFWMSIGVEGMINSGRLHHTDSIHRIENVIDGDDVPEQASVEYTVINWNERQMNIYAAVPLMFGYKHESGFYFGAGAKFGFSLYNKIGGDFGFADCNLYYDTKLPIMGIFTDLPLTDVQSRDKNFVNLPQVNPMVEIGWQGLDAKLTARSNLRFKFALVGELGVLSAYNNKNSAEQLFDYTSLDGFVPDDLPHFFESVKSFYSTIPLGISQSDFNSMKEQGKFVNFTKPSTLSAWMVGVKFSIMFEMPKPKDCNCLQNNVITPWYKKSKNRGVE